MMGKTHKIGGATLGLAAVDLAMCISLLNFNPIFIGLPLIAGSILGAFIPDIDSSKSTISRKLFLIAWPIWVIQKILNCFLRKSKSKIAKNIRSTINHRGFAHWPIIYLSLCLVTLIFYLITLPEYNTNIENLTLGTNGLISMNSIFYSMFHSVVFSFIFGLWIGALSHIILDSFNYQGVPLFAPFSFKKKSFGSIATSSDKELRFRFKLKVITFILFILFLLLCLGYLGVCDVGKLFESILKSFDEIQDITFN